MNRKDNEEIIKKKKDVVFNKYNPEILISIKTIIKIQEKNEQYKINVHRV